MDGPGVLVEGRGGGPFLPCLSCPAERSSALCEGWGGGCSGNWARAVWCPSLDTPNPPHDLRFLTDFGDSAPRGEEGRGTVGNSGGGVEDRGIDSKGAERSPSSASIPLPIVFPSSIGGKYSCSKASSEEDDAF